MKMNRTKETSTIEIRFDDEVFHMENTFIGGRIVEENGSKMGDNGSVMGFYGGTLDLGEMGISLMCLLRGAIKAFHEECDLSLHESEKIILCCLTEAFRREQEEQAKMDPREKELRELYAVVNRFTNNQNRP